MRKKAKMYTQGDIEASNASTEQQEAMKLVLKDELSERSASIRESSGSNSYQNRSNSLLRNNRNSETDLDKIIAGKEETRLNSISIGIPEEKDPQRKSDKIVLNNFNIGHFLREGGLRKTMTRIERKSIFKTILEEKDKDMILKVVIIDM